MCTSAPVVGVSSPKMESVIARKLMQRDRKMLSLMVFTQASDSRFRYGIFAISSLIRAISAAYIAAHCAHSDADVGGL